MFTHCGRDESCRPTHKAQPCAAAGISGAGAGGADAPAGFLELLAHDERFRSVDVMCFLDVNAHVHQGIDEHGARARKDLNLARALAHLDVAILVRRCLADGLVHPFACRWNEARWPANDALEEAVAGVELGAVG